MNCPEDRARCRESAKELYWISAGLTDDGSLSELKQVAAQHRYAAVGADAVFSGLFTFCPIAQVRDNGVRI